MMAEASVTSTFVETWPTVKVMLRVSIKFALTVTFEIVVPEKPAADAETE